MSFNLYIIPLFKVQLILLYVADLKWFETIKFVDYGVDSKDNGYVYSQSIKFYSDLFLGEKFFRVTQSSLIKMTVRSEIDASGQKDELIFGTNLRNLRLGLKALKEYFAHSTIKFIHFLCVRDFYL